MAGVQIPTKSPDFKKATVLCQKFSVRIVMRCQTLWTKTGCPKSIYRSKIEKTQRQEISEFIYENFVLKLSKLSLTFRK